MSPAVSCFWAIVRATILPRSLVSRGGSISLSRKIRCTKSDIPKEVKNVVVFCSKDYGLWLQTCATKESYEWFGIPTSGCMTTEIFSKALGLDFKKTPHKGNRAGCLCMESRGLGDYNSCPDGCRYCYANKDHNKALQNYLTHAPNSPLLLGRLRPTDKIRLSRQVSMLNREPSLF